MKQMLLLGLYIIFMITATSDGSGGGVTITQNQEQGDGEDTDTTKTLRVGYKLKLTCPLKTTDKNYEIKWFRQSERIEDTDERVLVFGNSTLVITKAKMEDIGLYTCRSDLLNQSFNISVIYLSYKKMTKSSTVFQGDQFSLICDVEGSPSPQVEWLKDGKRIVDFHNVTHFNLSENNKGTMNANLTIDAAEYDDRGQYMCFISSLSLNLTTTTFVRVKNMYAALWPFLGICAEVIILCFIIFVYERNRIKNDVEESDTDQPTDQKNSGVNKDSIRHRK